MKVLYHNDMDGKCAAHVVLSLDYRAEPGTCTIPMNYGLDVPFEHIGKDEAIYIVDFSIEPADMKKLLGITENVIWIDHHKTAIEKYKDFRWVDSGMAKRSGSESDIAGVRSTWGAGCELTYAYLYANNNGVPLHNGIIKTPEYVYLIGDRDTWTFKHGKRTRHFFAGLQAEDMSPDSPIWDVLRADGEAKVDQVVTVGGYIQRYKDRTQQDFALERGFWVDFADHRCYAVNGDRGSEPFEAVVPEAEVWIAFSYMPDGYWTVSLYSDKVDVSEIAKQYEYQGKRGGGHKGASGFQCAYPPFLSPPHQVPGQVIT